MAEKHKLYGKFNKLEWMVYTSIAQVAWTAGKLRQSLVWSKFIELIETNKLAKY